MSRERGESEEEREESGEAEGKPGETSVVEAERQVFGEGVAARVECDRRQHGGSEDLGEAGPVWRWAETS